MHQRDTVHEVSRIKTFSVSTNEQQAVAYRMLSIFILFRVFLYDRW